MMYRLFFSGDRSPLIYFICQLCRFLVVCPIIFDGLQDPRLIEEVGDLTTANHLELMT